jgi:cell pole-organizing protein PopZ
MSKPDTTGESLEAILAAIRKSLAEQSTGVLEETAPTSADDVPGAAELREQRFSAWLPDVAELAEEAVQPEPVPAAPAAPDELAEETPPPPPASVVAATAAASAPAMDPVPTAAAAPAPKTETAEMAEAPVKAATAQTADKTDKDPLWFLSQPVVVEKKEAAPAPVPAAAPRPAPASAGPPAAGAKPALKEIVRGPLPPFFGSSAEAAKVEVAPGPAMPAPPMGAALVPPVVTQPVPMARAPAGEPARPGVAQESAPRPPAAGSGAASEGASGANAGSLFAQPAGDGPAAPAGGQTQIQGLEGMVTELLRPMLRRWLDENMPRLVSAALKAEAELMSKRDPGRDPKKP